MKNKMLSKDNIIKKTYFIIILFGFFEMIYGQNVKFSHLKYEYNYRIEPSGKRYIDTITFFANLKYKNIQEINAEINNIQWAFGFIDDSITTLISRLDFKVKDDSLIISPHEKKYCSHIVVNNKIIFKSYIGDLKQSELLYIFFDVDYKLKYHTKYHNKKTVLIGGRKESEIENKLKTFKQSRFTYYR